MAAKSEVTENFNYGETDVNLPLMPSIEEKCRLCLKEADILIPISTGENGSGSAVALKIDILTTVKVAPYDKICSVCRLKIKRFYSFRIMCIRSDARIRGTLKRKQDSLTVEPEVSLPNDVSVVRVHGDPIRSYKRQKRVDPIVTMDLPDKTSSFQTLSKIGSSLTISPVLFKKELEENGNGYDWQHESGEGSSLEVGSGSMNSMSHNIHNDVYGESLRDRSGSMEETENLEVQIDPFMLMADDNSDQEQQNVSLNIRGQALYSLHGPDTNTSPRNTKPLIARGGSDRERALELIKQMTSTRKAAPALDGSFLDKPFKCDVCPESFSYYKSFVKHKQRHSGELQTFKCLFCSDVFPTSRQLQNHLKYHNVEKAFPCDQCERSFPTKERLQSHYTLHTGNKPHVCEICHKSFAYKSSYGLHIRKQHGEQPIKSQTFRCDKCHQEFDIFVDFKRHLRTHLGEKPFSCHVCNKAFASKSILNVHSRIHNGFKPYKCDICGQAFTQKQSLDYHMRRHNEENPFKCDHCGMTFQRRYFLEKHKEVQHGLTMNSTLSGGLGHNIDDGENNETSTDRISLTEGGNVADRDNGNDNEDDDDDDDDEMDVDPLKLEIVDSPVDDDSVQAGIE